MPLSMILANLLIWLIMSIISVIRSLMNFKIVLISIMKSAILYTGLGTTDPMSAGIATLMVVPTSCEIKFLHNDFISSKS